MKTRMEIGVMTKMPRKSVTIEGDEPSQIVKGFWIAGLDAVEDLAFIEKNVDTIVNVSGELPNVVAWGRRYIHYPLGFSFNKDRTCWNEALKAVKALHEERRGGKRILLNCFAGIDRSPTIGAKFLAEDMKISLLDAAALIQKARPVAFPHLSWWDRPRDWPKY
jgi:hypothetical protein